MAEVRTTLADVRTRGRLGAVSSRSVRPASLEEYVRNPVGHYVAGRSYVVWVDSPRFAGSAYFGRIDARELPDLVRLATLPETWVDPSGYDVVVDCGRLEGVDATTFAALLRFLDEVKPVMTKLRRAAIVRPAGLAGAVVAGVFHDQVRPTLRAALFTDRGEAFAWLGLPATARAHVDKMLAKTAGDAPLLRALRDELARVSAGASLATVARALGTSGRSLSRQLNGLGTSFRAELHRARLRVAEALLLDSELKLDAIASEIGFRSRAHFSELFHRATGETPSEFRARRR